MFTISHKDDNSQQYIINKGQKNQNRFLLFNILVSICTNYLENSTICECFDLRKINGTYNGIMSVRPSSTCLATTQKRFNLFALNFGELIIYIDVSSILIYINFCFQVSSNRVFSVRNQYFQVFEQKLQNTFSFLQEDVVNCLDLMT